MKKRDRLSVIYDLLKIINSKSKIKPTPLLRFSNLSTKSFNLYLSQLLETGLVAYEFDKSNRKHIVLTPKGFKYLEKYRYIVEFIDEFDLSP